MAFPDGNLSDEFVLALADLVDKKMIRIIDAVMIARAPPTAPARAEVCLSACSARDQGPSTRKVRESSVDYAARCELSGIGDTVWR